MEMKVKRVGLMLITAVTIGLCAAVGSSANAQCGFSIKQNRPVFANAIPSLAERAPAQTAAAQTAAVLDGDDATIVGLWDVKFIADNQVVDEDFDQYHSDGTEILNDTPPPATGNVCLGVYTGTKPGGRTIKLKHPSWIYDPTNTVVAGIATILEKITLDRGGRSFTGTFTVQIRDLMGNAIAPDFSGQLHGDRITPD
jgi:hypothetical protein